VTGSGEGRWDEDQCRTARIGELVWRRFGLSCTLAGLDLLLHQIGWSVQVLDRLAAKRDGRAKPDLLRKRVPLAD
jgi:hypothetical protein